MRILVSCDWYLPGWKAGGPIRSLSNLVEALGDEFEFRVVTGDRDFGEREPYPGVERDAWRRLGKARVMHLSPARQGFLSWRRLLRETPHDLLYLNSFFSTRFTVAPLLLRRLGAISRRPVLLAPRGELAPGHLVLKAYKKSPFCAAARSAGLYRGVRWHAAGAGEDADIRRAVGNPAARFQVPPLVAPGGAPRREDRAGEALRVVFLSRVSREKNLDGALRMLAGVRAPVRFDIYGPIKDGAYWEECERLAAALPPGVVAAHRGALRPEEVVPALGGYDLLLLPTLGENFGHAVAEALVAGCPVLLSDRTPWRGLRAMGVGWDLPLDRPAEFTKVLQEFAELGPEGRADWSRRARACGERLILEQNRDVVGRYREMFRWAAAGTAGT